MAFCFPDERPVMEILVILLLHSQILMMSGQEFYFGADQSYVNEMEDCGADYRENGQSKDVYQIFQDHGCNLVRLRLWHNPAWYDHLNQGKRYSDMPDVIKSIRRAKDHGMKVLLNYHLSDNWADPSKQLVPAAWEGVVHDLPSLKDSLYQYIYQTLMSLYEKDLLPEMVQIGNETNKGILLSPEDNQTWTLDWSRNAILFNEGIRAVRAVTSETGIPVKVALHVAGPADVEWMIDQFVIHGVVDFDIIGMSYYWAWHKPVTIEETGAVIKNLKEKYAGKEIMVVETGYLWTTDNADAAPNIINEQHPDYLPAKPENQKKWLIDLTTEVIKQGGTGVIYWEPSWVSTPCYNQWNQGSHQDHATFFDFEHDLLISGGIEWMEHDYSPGTPASDAALGTLQIHSSAGAVVVTFPSGVFINDLYFILADTLGKIVDTGEIRDHPFRVDCSHLTSGAYFFTLLQNSRVMMSKKIVL